MDILCTAYKPCIAGAQACDDLCAFCRHYVVKGPENSPYEGVVIEFNFLIAAIFSVFRCSLFYLYYSLNQ